MDFDESKDTNHSTFPQALKITTSEILVKKLNLHDQLLVIYYNKYKSSKVFSFEHLCEIAAVYLKTQMKKFIYKFRETNKWDVHQLGERRISYLINLLLT